ncbi:hypothetical protein Tco_0995747 [Tanacetum coccineum]
MVVQNQQELGKGSAILIDPHHTPTIIESSTQPQKTQKPRKPKRKDTQVPRPSGPTDIIADEVVHKELGDSGGPRCQETIRDTIAQTRVLDLEKIKTTQAKEIVNLKRRVKKLEQKKRSRTHGLKRLIKVSATTRVESSGDEQSLGEDASKQGRRINDIDEDEDITLVNVQDDAEMFDVNTLTGDEVFAEQEVAAKDVNLTIDEVTLAQALATLKSVKPKVKGVFIQDPSTTTISSQQPSQDTGKGIMAEEPVKTMKKKDLIRLDEETAKNYKLSLMKRKDLQGRKMKPMLP